MEDNEAKETDKTLLPENENEVPENTAEYVEKLLIENIRNIKFAEKENIPADIKSARLQYLEQQQHLLLDRLEGLKAANNSAVPENS